MTLVQAIARMEGFYVKDSRADRNDNPGNLQYGSFARDHGAIGTDGRFAIFPNALIGFDALQRLLAEFYGHLTLAQAIAKYAPENENNTANYLKNICEWTGAQPTDTVSRVLTQKETTNA